MITVKSLLFSCLSKNKGFAMSFEDRFQLLVDYEYNQRQTNTIA